MTPTESVQRARVVEGDLEYESLDAALASGRVGVDIETTGLDWALHRIATVQVNVPDRGTSIVRISSSDKPSRLVELVESPKVMKVFHHAAFDLRFMTFSWGLQPSNLGDTKVISKILRPNLEPELHSLAKLVDHYFSVTLDKSVRLSDWGAQSLTSEQIAYAASDVDYLIPLFEQLMFEAVDAGVADLVEASMRYLPARIITDLRGCGDLFAY